MCAAGVCKGLCVCPAGEMTELRLRTYPRGSASGFTTIQMPVTLTIHNPLFTRFVANKAPPTASVTPPLAPMTPLSELVPPPEPEPESEPIPIITGTDYNPLQVRKL